MIYTVDFFINKFSAIPEDKWHVGDYANSDNTKFCALGHCRRQLLICSEESDALCQLFAWHLNLSVVQVNDGSSVYQQPTPKQRILAALYDIKSLQAVKQAEDIINSPAQLIA